MRASTLLHHLLNQSLTGVDFCILWQALIEECDELAPINEWVLRFIEEADLSALDRALAMLPEPLEGEPLPRPEGAPAWQSKWMIRSQRIREVTRVVFTCPNCAWEIAYSLEHDPNTEMKLPFEELECPNCDT